MLEIFKGRGYPLILKIIDSVHFDTRNNLINPGPKEPCPYETFMVLEYTPDLDIRQLKSLVTPNDQEKEHIPNICLSFKKAKNLSNSLVRAKLNNVIDPIESTETITIQRSPYLDGRSAMCGIHGCKCCKAMSKKCTIFSIINNRGFKTTKHSNCSSSNVIYLCECKKCANSKQYVGQTKRKLSERVAGHRAKAKLVTSNHLPTYSFFFWILLLFFGGTVISYRCNGSGDASLPMTDFPQNIFF